VCSLGFPESMGKTSGLNFSVRCLKFFKERDAAFGECQGRYGHLQSVAFLKAYGASWHPCVHRRTLVEHVPSVLVNAMLMKYHALTWVGSSAILSVARGEFPSCDLLKLSFVILTLLETLGKQQNRSQRHLPPKEASPCRTR
jgi:hypothetical protein